MNRLTLPTLSLLAAAGLLLVGCSSSGNAAQVPTGVWGDPDDRTVPSLEFVPKDTDSSSGEYHGTDGCNRVFGSYSQAEDGVIDLGNMASTMMFCEGVDTWLSGAQTAVIDGDALTLFDTDGSELGSLDAHKPSAT